jgi:hypothetical protein
MVDGSLMKRFSFLLGTIESDLVFREKPSGLPTRGITRFDDHEAICKYVVIADERFNIGDAWYCQDKTSGSIYRLSPEYGPPVQFVNSSMRLFKASLKAAGRWSAQHDSSAIKSAPRLVDHLADSLLKIDPKAFASPKYQWPSLMDHIRVCASDADEEMAFWFEVA